jgi:pimeloyl-ACP methyl ester carboxylesterase
MRATTECRVPAAPSRCLPLSLAVDGRPVRGQVWRAAEAGAEPSLLRVPLLLLHGLGCSSAAWGPALRCLGLQALDQPVYAPDMPGYGRSPGPAGALGIAELADWSARFLDAHRIARAHVAGSSMGCQVALAMARRHPERVGGVVLVGPTCGRQSGLGRYLAGLLVDGTRETLRYNSTLAWMYLQMGLPRYLATVRKMMQDDPLAAAGQVAATTLIVRGERDGIVSDAFAGELAAALPGGAFLRVPGAAHAAQFTRPDRFTALALAFLAGAQRGPSEAEPR